MKTWLASLRTRWDAWTLRERRMVLGMGIVALLAVVYLVLVDPALQGRKRLLRDLPRLRADAAEMAGIAQTPGRPARPAAIGDLRTALASTLEAAGLEAAVAVHANGAVEVKFDKIAYVAAAGWAQAAARDAGARLESAVVGSSGEGGRVNAEFVFVR